jgi:hypothetical protein
MKRSEFTNTDKKQLELMSKMIDDGRAKQPNKVASSAFDT